MKQLITFSFLLIAVLVHAQEKNPLFGNFGMSFSIIELTDNSLVMVKQFFEL